VRFTFGTGPPNDPPNSLRLKYGFGKSPRATVGSKLASSILSPNDHAESAEMWLVFSGKIRYAFEGQEPFIASEGDVVYVPANTWHATRYIGDSSCRLSITEYVGNALLLPPQ